MRYNSIVLGINALFLFFSYRIELIGVSRYLMLNGVEGPQTFDSLQFNVDLVSFLLFHMALLEVFPTQ